MIDRPKDFRQRRPDGQSGWVWNLKDVRRPASAWSMKVGAADRHDGVFLFADEDAVVYYERTGFTPIEECVVTTRLVPTKRRSGAVKLDPRRVDHLEKIRGYVRRRTPVSDLFSVQNEKLVMFHVLYTLSNCVYEIPDLSCLVFCEHNDHCLRLFDIVGERIPALAEIYPYFPVTGNSVAELHFQADKLGLGEATTRVLQGNNPFVRGVFPVDKPVFPFTSRA